ncbi:MAG: hypothetical protein ACLTZU_02770 [Odoribacter splanchnicus]
MITAANCATVCNRPSMPDSGQQLRHDYRLAPGIFDRATQVFTYYRPNPSV